MSEQKSLLVPGEAAAPALTTGGVMALLEKVALQHGEDTVAKMERLMDLAIKADQINAQKAFSHAFASFREAMPAVIKSRKQGGGAARDGGAGFQWWYAPIEQIMATAEPHLRANGLYVQWGEDATSQDATTVTCTLHHAAGHSRSARATVRKGSKNPKLTPGQIDAGALTSAMRRALSMVLGIVTSDPESDYGPADAITEEQGIELETLLSQLKGDRKPAFLKWLGAASLSEVPAARFAEAKDFLVRAIQKESGQ